MQDAFEVVSLKLTPEDDREFWRTVLDTLKDEFLQRIDRQGKQQNCILLVGACSHWVRPHNSRWDAAGGFVWPEGYRDGSPELDWFVTLAYRNQTWIVLEKPSGKRQIVLRAAVPTRTIRHKQAAIHTRWSPGGEIVLYGFRNRMGLWKCVAASDEKSQGRVALASKTGE